MTAAQREALRTLQSRYDEVRTIPLFEGLYASCYREDGAREVWKIDRYGYGTLKDSTVREHLAGVV